jgi:hypothetical protein
MTSFREENGGEQLYSALKALGRLEDDFREMLTSWELSPERQAECPTENVLLDGHPDQTPIDLRGLPRVSNTTVNQDFSRKGDMTMP